MRLILKISSSKEDLVIPVMFFGIMFSCIIGLIIDTVLYSRFVVHNGVVDEGANFIVHVISLIFIFTGVLTVGFICYKLDNTKEVFHD